MDTRRRFVLAFGLVATVGFGMFVGIGFMPAQPGTAESKSAPRDGKRTQAFIDAFNKGDAKAVASFWTVDGDYTDQVGRKVSGRPALEKLYEKVFSQSKGSQLKIYIGSIRPVTADVAIEEGVTEVIPADGGLPTAAAFTAVLVKQDGEWYFRSVHDSVARPPSNAERFEDLEWLIGDWVGAEAKGESARSSYHWAENKNFIVSSFATTFNGVPVVGGTQWIAWDAVDKQIRSYSFYSGGGVGEGIWSKAGNSWSIKTSARSADGKKISATNIITPLDAQTATWQITQFHVDGKSLPDSPAIKMKRVNPVRP